MFTQAFVYNTFEFFITEIDSYNSGLINKRASIKISPKTDKINIRELGLIVLNLGLNNEDRNDLHGECLKAKRSHLFGLARHIINLRFSSRIWPENYSPKIFDDFDSFLNMQGDEEILEYSFPHIDINDSEISYENLLKRQSSIDKIMIAYSFQRRHNRICRIGNREVNIEF